MIYQQHGESFFLLPFQQQNQPLKNKKEQNLYRLLVSQR